MRCVVSFLKNYHSAQEEILFRVYALYGRNKYIAVILATSITPNFPFRSGYIQYQASIVSFQHIFFVVLQLMN